MGGSDADHPAPSPFASRNPRQRIFEHYTAGRLASERLRRFKVNLWIWFAFGYERIIQYRLKITPGVSVVERKINVCGWG
jgi:hypothetical protein